MPTYGIGAEEVAEEAGNVAEAIGFVAMNSVIIVGEGILEKFFPEAVETTEAFRDEAKELAVGSFLAAHFNDHGR